MEKISPLKTLFLFFSLLIGTFASCRQTEKKGKNTTIETEKRYSDSQKQKKHHKRDRNQDENSEYVDLLEEKAIKNPYFKQTVHQQK